MALTSDQFGEDQAAAMRKLSGGFGPTGRPTLTGRLG
jgi:hypothetical protein